MLKIKWSKFANMFLFNRLLAPGGGGTLNYGFNGSKVTTINYSSVFIVPAGMLTRFTSMPDLSSHLMPLSMTACYLTGLPC